MTFIAVVRHDSQNMITKYLEFATRTEAEDHVAIHGGFATEIPAGGSLPNLLVDPVAETVSIFIPPPVPAPLPEDTKLTLEDVERLLLSEVPGMTRAKINQAKNDRGKPIP